MMPKAWTSEQIEVLDQGWGTISIPSIAQKLGKSINAVKIKAYKLGYQRHIHAGEYITLNQLMQALGRGMVHNYTLTSWVKNRGLPVKNKKSIKKSYRIIYLNDFWKWAKENRTFIDFFKVTPGYLGKEPEWVKEQRKADILSAQYKKTPWSSDEDSLLKSMLNSYNYSYRDISIRLKRTEGAIKRRMLDLKIKKRPLKADNHNPWTEDEMLILVDLLEKGYRAEVIAEFIDRSALAIKGKIERMEKWKKERELNQAGM
jgi:hypothetical protein